MITFNAAISACDLVVEIWKASTAINWKRMVSFEEFSVAKGYILRYSMEQNALHVFGFQNGERDQICLRYNTNHHGKDLDRSIACC